MLRCVVEGARWLGEPSDAALPTKSAISQARIRLGAAPLEALYRAVVATAGAPGAWYRSWRVMSLDGTTLDVGDTAVNAAAFGRPASARGVNTTGAFPQIRLVGLLENGTHAITAAQLGAYGTHERVLAVDVLAGLTGEMLCLADRGFLGFDLWRTAAATGAALVWRAPATVTLPVLERSADGSYRSALRWNPQMHQPGSATAGGARHRVHDGGRAVPGDALSAGDLDPRAGARAGRRTRRALSRALGDRDRLRRDQDASARRAAGPAQQDARPGHPRSVGILAHALCPAGADA